MGSQEHRNTVIQTRKLHPDHAPIPDNIHIAKDGEPVRILGAWIGNNTTQAEPWAATLEKIDRSLNQWSKSHPTMAGRRLIIQMTIAGMTQFLTKAQGMPQEIEKKLSKRISNFMWGHESIPPVSTATLCSPIRSGGLKVLDLPARNKAITLTWLKTYLQLDSKRPIWTLVADELINRATSKNVTDRATKINMFIQTWGTNPNARSQLPPDLVQMIRTGKEFGIEFQALLPSQSLREGLPIWYHIGAAPALQEITNKPEAKCQHKGRSSGKCIGR